MNFNKYHVSRNLANLYNVDKTSLNLRFTTDNNMTIKINGVKGNGMNIIPLVSPGISLPAGQYTVMIKMISGTISGLTDGVFFGINGNTYSQRTTPGILQVGDVGVRAFTLSEDTMLSSIDIAPGYDSPGSVFTDAVFECMLVSGSYTVQTMPSYEPYSSEVWHDVPYYIHNTSTDTITTLPAVLYPNAVTATVGLKGNTSQQSGTTTVPSKSVTVSSLESGTNYALFPKTDFPDAVVGDAINIVVGGTSYSQKVMKIDTSYVYIENRTV